MHCTVGLQLQRGLNGTCAFFRKRAAQNYILASNTESQIQSHPAPSLDPKIRQELTAGYRNDILMLQRLIERDLSHWLQ